MAQKIFWSRGNGLGICGLVNIMEPSLSPQVRSINTFLKFIKNGNKLLQNQTPEGHWAMSLLDKSFYPTRTSGTSLMCMGLAGE